MTTNSFDFESLTLDEVETIELLTGASIDQITVSYTHLRAHETLS
jgi:hypothetical protein